MRLILNFMIAAAFRRFWSLRMRRGHEEMLSHIGLTDAECEAILALRRAR